jgi:hypothetical protein
MSDMIARNAQRATVKRCSPLLDSLVAGVGFEPTTFGL